MRAVGLVTEYNPFHNGHLHHLRESLKVADAEVSVAVMSGHFLQRGEPALVDKWLRTEMALAAGVDVVVELPLPWACSSAPDFARGAVQALNAVGGIEALCFGSEAGELDPLRRCADLLMSREGELAARTAQLLRNGVNYPQARAQVLSELLPERADADIAAAPNNILGIAYLKALKQTGSALRPLTIQRVGAGYHDTGVGANNIASATGIRMKLAAGEDVVALVPVAAYAPLRAALLAGERFSPDNYFALLTAQLLRSPQTLSEHWLIEHGIENRLLRVAEQAADLEELIAGCKSRQLTRTRIQRLLAAVYLGISKSTASDLLNSGPRYLQLLGLSDQGARFLAASRKQRSLPLIQNFSRVHSALKRFYGAETPEHALSRQQLDLQLRATKLYALLLKNPSTGSRNRDFYQPLRRVE